LTFGENPVEYGDNRRDIMKKETAGSLDELRPDKFYGILTVQNILKDLNLNYSIYTIRDYETWKCLDYKCGYRHNVARHICIKCGGEVRPPLIKSPRTRGGGKGVGHRRYTADEIRELVEIFKQRR
jgi:hypothetical protein